MDINLRADLTLKDKSEVKDIILKDPILNNKFVLTEQKKNDTEDNKSFVIRITDEGLINETRWYYPRIITVVQFYKMGI